MEHNNPANSEHLLTRQKRYRVTSRITKEAGEVSAGSADEACKKLGWAIGDCFIEELGIMPQ